MSGSRLLAAMRMDERKLRQLALFLLIFNLLAIPMYLMMFYDVQVYAWQMNVTGIVYSILKFFGSHVLQPNPSLPQIFIMDNLTYVPIVIDMDCTAWKSMFALAALMIATPVPNDERKLTRMLAGIGVIYVLNIVRIVTTIMFAGTYGLQYLDVVHTVFWREGMIFAVLAMWGIWLRSMRKAGILGRGGTMATGRTARTAKRKNG